jgi:type I restriction enzyme, S subunit
MKINDWKEYLLEDIIQFKRGYDLPKTKMKEGPYPVIGSNGIIGYHNKFKVKNICLTVGRSGNIGKPLLIKTDSWPHNTTLFVEKFKNITLEYAYYLLQTLKLENYGGGSAVPTLNRNHLSHISIKLPKLNIQEKIINILQTIENKVLVNNKINEKLEQVAKALYNEWFVNFNFPDENGLPYKDNGGEFYESELGEIPVGWEVKALGDLTSKFTTGLNPRKNFVLGQGNNYYVTIKNMSEGTVVLDDRCDRVDNEALAIINKRSQLQQGDLLFSGIGTIGRVYYINETPKNWNISESIFTIRPNDMITSEFLYRILLTEHLQEYVQQLSSGSVQKGIRMGDFREYKISVPTKEINLLFSEKYSKILNKQKENEKEKIVLNNLKNILLNKFMSGQIDVDDLNINWDNLSKTLEEIEKI